MTGLLARAETDRVRSGDGPLSVNVRPSSLKRDRDRRTTSSGGRTPSDVHARSRLTLETTADTPVRNQGPGRGCPDRTGHPLYRGRSTALTATPSRTGTNAFGLDRAKVHELEVDAASVAVPLVLAVGWIGAQLPDLRTPLGISGEVLPGIEPPASAPVLTYRSIAKMISSRVQSSRGIGQSMPRCCLIRVAPLGTPEPDTLCAKYVPKRRV
jgi:hypothetical protein